MLALRSLLLIDALDESALRAARKTHADAVLIDLAGAPGVGHHVEARASALKHAKAIAKAGVSVLARVSAPRTEQMDADVEALVGAWLAGVVIAGVEEPQDARDVDVQVRKHEMRRTKAPGAIALIVEVDSAKGLLALPRILPAIDRIAAIVLNADAIIDDTHAPALVFDACSQVAMSATAHEIDWVLQSRGDNSVHAQGYGASGVVVFDDEHVAALNELFSSTSDAGWARPRVAAWKRRDGAKVVAVEDDVVDRRAARRAQRVLDRIDTIKRREG